MKAVPPIREFMTPSPLTIGADQPVAKARAMMRDREVRHLPVLRGGKLDGMISERDIAMIESIDGVDTGLLKVESAMTNDVYAVTPSTSLIEVASEMATRKYGSVVVVDHGKVIGIFTTVDLATALVEFLQPTP